MNKPTLSVVIGSYNRLSFIKTTIDTLRKEIVNIPHEIIIVDGGSNDGTIDWLTKQKDIISIIQHNRGEWLGKPIERRSWGYFMNLGFKIAQGKYVCMLSDDCLVIPGAIKNGIKQFDQELRKKHKVGAIAFYWRNWPEQQKYWVGYSFGDRMFVNHGLYLRKAMEEVGFCDEDNFSFYHADGDLGQRMWEAGYSCIAADKSFIEHYSDANSAVRATNNIKQKEDWATYERRWNKLGEPHQDWKELSYKDPTNTALKYWRNRYRLDKLKKITKIK